MGNPNIKNYGFGSKNRTKEQDDEYRERSKGVKRTITWTKHKCIEELNDILDILKRVLKDDAKIDKDNPKKLKQETVRDCLTLINKILDYVKYLYPPVQQNLNVNVDITADAVIERLKNWKKNQIVVVEENEED